jgi:di/tricarboxylate transporter
LGDFQILQIISEFQLSIGDEWWNDPSEVLGVNAAAIPLAPLHVFQLFGAYHWIGYLKLEWPVSCSSTQTQINVGPQ